FFEVADISLCSGLRVCSPPRSFLPLRDTAAEQLRLLRPSRTCCVTSHASDMLAARIQVIDGTGTLTPQDSQPCRLLPSVYASNDTSRCRLQDSKPGWIRYSPFL